MARADQQIINTIGRVPLSLDMIFSCRPTLITIRSFSNRSGFDEFRT